MTITSTSTITIFNTITIATATTTERNLHREMLRTPPRLSPPLSPATLFWNKVVVWGWRLPEWEAKGFGCRLADIGLDVYGFGCRVTEGVWFRV